MLYPIHSSLSRRRSASALFLVILSSITIASFFSSCSGKNKYDHLVKKYLVPYSPSADLDVTSIPTPSWALGIEKYKQGEYKDMEAAFNQLKPGNAYYYKAHYVMGIVALQQHQPFKAIDEFKAVRANPESKYFKDAQWMTALAYLEAGIPARAKDILNAILNSEKHHYKKQAKALLNEL